MAATLADMSLAAGLRHLGWRRLGVCGAVALLVVALPHRAFAEVSDKAASIPEHWMLALPFATVALIAAWWRWWLAIPLGWLLVAKIWVGFEMFVDPDIGRALLREQGIHYFLSLWGSDLLVATGLVAGFLLGWFSRDDRRRASQRRVATQ